MASRLRTVPATAKTLDRTPPKRKWVSGSIVWLAQASKLGGRVNTAHFSSRGRLPSCLIPYLSIVGPLTLKRRSSRGFRLVYRYSGIHQLNPFKTFKGGIHFNQNSWNRVLLIMFIYSSPVVFVRESPCSVYICEYPLQGLNVHQQHHHHRGVPTPTRINSLWKVREIKIGNFTRCTWNVHPFCVKGV